MEDKSDSKNPQDLQINPPEKLKINETFTVSESLLKKSFLGNCKNIRFSRPLSWDFCYRHFLYNHVEYLSDNPSEALFNQGALELSSYLGSFGMFRNKKTASVNRRIYVSVLKALFKTVREKGLNPFQHNEPYDPKTIGDLVLTLHVAFNNAFRNEAKYEDETTMRRRKTKTDYGEASKILISKVLLGTLCVMPAFDTNFAEMAQALNTERKKQQLASLPSDLEIITIKDQTAKKGIGHLKLKTDLTPLCELANDKEVQKFLRKHVESCFKEADILPKRTRYPIMRLLDLYFWGIGPMIHKK